MREITEMEDAETMLGAAALARLSRVLFETWKLALCMTGSSTQRTNIFL
jgi:hypothetical protein